MMVDISRLKQLIYEYEFDAFIDIPKLLAFGMIKSYIFSGHGKRLIVTFDDNTTVDVRIHKQ